MTQDKQAIAFIGGTGPEGLGLAMRFAQAGREVIIGSRRQDRADEAAQKIRDAVPNANASGLENKAAVAQGEVVFITVPFDGQEPTLQDLRAELAGKIVVDTVVPLQFEKGKIRALILDDGSAAEQANRILPDSIVVGAFQNLSAHELMDLEHDVPADVVVWRGRRRLEAACHRHGGRDQRVPGHRRRRPGELALRRGHHGPPPQYQQGPQGPVDDQDRRGVVAPPEVRLIGITGLPEVHSGDDLPAMLIEAAARQGTPLEDGDVLVVTQKVVSKAEGRVLKLAEIDASPFAQSFAAKWDKEPGLVEAVLRQSRRIVKMDQGVLITENLLGHICANGGVDASNLETQGTVALLPEDPDRWCSQARAEARKRLGVEIAVIMSDTFGRPWRDGCTNVAIGVSGMDPMIDYRGQLDPAGMVLKVTVIAIADGLAAATEPIMGKFNRVPATIVRGYDYPKGEGGAAALLRDPSKDLFR